MQFVPTIREGVIINPILGCDPEFFFIKGKSILGSEKVIPENGIIHKPASTMDRYRGKIVVDGVQAEINPVAESCREFLSHNISRCLQELQKELIAKHPKLVVSFGQSFTVRNKELMSLSDKARVLGCSPSSNAYKEKPRISIQIAQNVRTRSGGGHIHLGCGNDSHLKAILRRPDKIVPLLDLVLGNTCVLIDRDLGNIKRRKYYGRAGEYRSPEHGLEYRVLSNFWMRNYALMSFVFGVARQTLIIAANSGFAYDFAKELTSKVKRIDVKRAINRNDAELAQKNFDAIAPLIAKWFPREIDRYPLNRSTIPLFRHFAEKGLDYWFKEDPFKHWTSLDRNRNSLGWGRFAADKVYKDLHPIKTI